MTEENAPDLYSPLFLLLIDLVIWWLLGQVITDIGQVFLNVICLSAALVFLVIFVFESLEILKSNRRSGG